MPSLRCQKVLDKPRFVSCLQRVAISNQRLRVGGIERPQRYARCGRFSHQQRQHVPEQVITGDLIVAVGCDHHHRQAPQPSGKESQQIERRRIGPVEILQHENERALGADTRKEVANEVEESVLAGHCRELGLIADGFWNGRQAVNGPVVTIDLDPGSVGRRRRQVVAAAGQHETVSPFGLVDEVVDESGLTDPGLATDQNERAMTPGGIIQKLMEFGTLAVPAVDRRALATTR